MKKFGKDFRQMSEFLIICLNFSYQNFEQEMISQCEPINHFLVFEKISRES